MKIKIKKIHPMAIIPHYAHKGDAGMDLYSVENFILNPLERRAVAIGIQMAIPDGFVGLIWDKSGLALNSGIKTMAGVVDAGYRGEIKAVLLNVNSKAIEIKAGTKIAQMLIQRIEAPKIEETNSLDQTSRGKSGFGSTG